MIQLVLTATGHIVWHISLHLSPDDSLLPREPRLHQRWWPWQPTDRGTTKQRRPRLRETQPWGRHHGCHHISMDTPTGRKLAICGRGFADTRDWSSSLTGLEGWQSRNQAGEKLWRREKLVLFILRAMCTLTPWLETPRITLCSILQLRVFQTWMIRKRTCNKWSPSPQGGNSTSVAYN